MPSPAITYLKDYSAPAFLVETIDLFFDLEEDVTQVTSTLHLRCNPAQLEKKPLVLNGEALVLVSLSLDGRVLQTKDYLLDSETLTLQDLPDMFSLKIVTRIQPQNNTTLSGLYKTGNNFCTQCEAQGFRRITYFMDRPDVMARYTTTIEADREKYPVLLSNGNLINETKKGRRYQVTWQDPFKKPCYLFALVAGDLIEKSDRFKTQSGRDIAIKLYVEKTNEEKMDHALYSIKQAMKWDELNFGREYDLDVYSVVAVSYFNMGAMENKGLNIFNDRYVLANPSTATDQDYEAITSVIGHEYFHNWTGNRITCRDWFQLSLKEGLTVFRDQEFSRSLFSATVERIDTVRLLRTRQFAEDEGPLAHPVQPESYIEIDNFYTATVYNKGAEVVRMIQTLLGKSGFRKGMDLYFERHDGQAVTIEEFVKAMEEANQFDLKQFRLWYRQAGTPVVEVKDRFDEKEKKYFLDFTQHCPPTPQQTTKKPMHIPIALGLLNPEGDEIPLKIEGDAVIEKNKVLSFTQEKMQVCFNDVHQKPTPSLLRDFSAPVKLHYDYDESALALLIRHDTDGFNRSDAMQRWSIKIIFKLIADYKENKKLLCPPLFLSALEDLLKQPMEEDFLSELFTLPSEIYLATLMDVVEVEGIHQVRQFLRKAIATQLKDLFIKNYQVRDVSIDYKHEDAGKRRFKNICLSYLMCLEDPLIQAMCLNQFEKATNMTDQLAAFSFLTNQENPFRLRVIDDFYKHWKSEHLVIDKWFSLQALSEAPDTFTRVFALSTHPDFNLKNPNRVRALVGAFTSGNHYYFHATSGQGYRFLSDFILKLDGLNPQVAARLVEPLMSWRKYDKTRQTLMKTELEKIKQKPSLSTALFELVTKGLGISQDSYI